MFIQQVYGALLPAKNLPEPLHTLQGDLVDQIILNPHFEIYPPSVTYQRAFWKYVTQTIEAADEEVDDRIYQRYISLLKASTAVPDQYLSSPPTPSYITYFWPPLASHGEHLALGPRKITLLESRTTIEAGTTGLRTWRASLMLSEWLTIHPEIVQHHRVLELGSGVGFLGIMIAALQRLPHQRSGMSLGGSDASHARIPNQPAVCLTDVNEDVLQRCRYNIGLPTSMESLHPSLNSIKLSHMKPRQCGRPSWA
ncbi:hypothetical protein BS47DRAFT_1010622 [Hydnum rufescens UP504]|uniref:Uncharacterized protein n=1 Tax=Hydnum rufescens UP504 TaxID=1448309 RepID=A0A9P6AW43_9AGAM|nr:hypothetical protein BS47DRAFT_1010622 [Hydnum rufescens UP504]